MFYGGDRINHKSTVFARITRQVVLLYTDLKMIVLIKIYQQNIFSQNRPLKTFPKHSHFPLQNTPLHFPTTPPTANPHPFPTFPQPFPQLPIPIAKPR